MKNAIDTGNQILMVDMLLKHTESGPVTEWIERLAKVARNLGLPLYNIDWNGSPKQVANNLIGYSFKYHSSHEPMKNILTAKLNLPVQPIQSF